MQIEGLTPEEVLSIPAEQFDELLFTGKPLVLRAGSAEILCEFTRTDDTLSLQLAHIDGGGEGVLPTLAALARRYSVREGLRFVEWFVYATNCARPNPKLRRVLGRKGFEVLKTDRGECYYLKEPVGT